MRQGKLSFGKPDELESFLGVQSDSKCLIVRKADVFRREPYQASSDIQWILAGFKHSGKPVQGRVNIRVPQRFMKCGNDVVVFLAALVVEQLPLGSLLNDVDGDFLARHARLRSEFQDIQSCARVAVRDGGNRDQARHPRSQCALPATARFSKDWT